jgi:hypothetical protein
MSKITENSYKLIDGEGDHYTVVLLEEYKETMFRFNTIKMSEHEHEGEDGEGYCKLTFNYTILAGDDSLDGNPEFDQYIGQVLQFIIMDAFTHNTYTLGEKNESAVDTDNNTKKPSK